MIPLSVTPDMDRAPWDDLDPLGTGVLHGTITRVGLLRNGTVRGRATVAVAIRLDDGRHVIAETTFALARTAAQALAASPVAAEEVLDP